MYPVNLCKKLLSVRRFLANSTDSCVLHQKNQLLCGANLLGSYNNQMLFSFCSLVNVDLSESGVTSKSAKKRNKSAEQLDKNKSYLVSYLMNSCGFSQESAFSVAAKFRSRNSKNPISILALLEKYELSKTQIAMVAKKAPQLLAYKEKTLVPKLEFFLSNGMSKALLADIVSRYPTMFSRSLVNWFIPYYKFLKSVLLTDERVVSVMKRGCWYSHKNAEKNLVANVEVLRGFKVPESSIILLMTYFAEALVFKTEEFKETVSKVLEMEFDPSKVRFVLAIHALSGDANKIAWSRCYETYSNWGWSRDDIYMAFGKHPQCMLMSDKKIYKTMDYLVNEIGLDSRMVAEHSIVLSYSLKNRTIPRFSVIHVLLSKGLIKRFELTSVMSREEKYFLDKFVVPYEEELPKLFDFYKGKIGKEEL